MRNVLLSFFGEVCSLKVPMPLFEPDNGKRLKRFRYMLLEDWKKDAALSVNGIRIPVHREVLAASSAFLASFGEVVPITDSSMDAVQHFTWYLYGINVFEDDELTI